MRYDQPLVHMHMIISGQRKKRKNTSVAKGQISYLQRSYSSSHVLNTNVLNAMDTGRVALFHLE